MLFPENIDTLSCLTHVTENIIPETANEFFKNGACFHIVGNNTIKVIFNILCNHDFSTPKKWVKFLLTCLSYDKAI